MNRHIIDHPRVVDAGLRLREFLRIERMTGLHPSVRALHIRAHDRDEDTQRVAHFLRIERGRTA